MKKIRLAAFGAVTLCLFGCAAPPMPEQAAAQVPPQWFAPLPHNGTLADLASWWRQFNDPLLVEMLDAAQTASPTVATAASRIRQARATRAAAGAALLPTLKALVALTAVPEPRLREKLTASWTDPGQGAGLAVSSVPARLLAQRPDIYQAEREVAAAGADVGNARAQRYPRLSLSGSIAGGRVHTGGIDTGAQTWSIGPLAVSLPIFDGGRRAANVEAAQARYQEAEALYAARVRQAVREVEEALVSLVELEEVRRASLAAETALVGLQREHAAAWIALYRAMGGGWARPDADAGAAETS